MNCKDCKHWHRLEQYGAAQLGKCIVIVGLNGVEPYSDSKAGIMVSELDVDAYLETRADFGCILFEAK